MRRDLSHWRTWHESERKLSLYPNRKFISAATGPTSDKRTAVRHTPPTFGTDTPSAIYVPKDGQLKWADELVELLEGNDQPLREF